MEKDPSSFEYCSGLVFERTRIGGRWSIKQWVANSFENLLWNTKKSRNNVESLTQFWKKNREEKKRLERARWNEIWREWSGWRWGVDQYRFSAFWLRSKCSICSYQLNIWYGLHSRSRILNWFLTDWVYGWACSPGPAGCNGIALHPYAASLSTHSISMG